MIGRRVMSEKDADRKGFKALLLFGPPGSGKGTLGKVLAQAADHVHLSSGDVFRGLDPQSAQGKLFREYADKGRLVPDEVTIEIWHLYVLGLIKSGAYDPDKQFLLLDGIPRTVRQVNLIMPYLDLQSILVLEMSDVEGLINRLVGRAKIEGRVDDQDPAVLRTRMDVYQSETAVILDHLPKELITWVDAGQTKLRVLRDVLGKLADLLNPPL